MAIFIPHVDDYTDEAATRNEMTRVFDVCEGCRACLTLCDSFPTLFELIDGHDDRDAGRLTPAQQDLVTDLCVQCKLCVADCPYAPGVHEAGVDVPKLVLRARAMQRSNDHSSRRNRMTARILMHADRVGRLATSANSIANRIVEAQPGSIVRRTLSKVTGVSSKRTIPSFASQRFSEWFAQRPKINFREKQAAVTIFPTCLVEYQATDIGKDLVKVYERNGVECYTTEAGCCGAPLLHAGEIERFSKVVAKNVQKLAAEVRRGTDIVVAQPSCSYVLKHDALDHLTDPDRRADAELVAEHTFDASEYLMTLHRADDYVLDTDFEGFVPTSITYLAPSEQRAQHNGFKGRDLMKLTGTRVKLAPQSMGLGGLWGLRTANEGVARRAEDELASAIDGAEATTIVSDCHLANTAITQRTGREVQHPLQILARAYGIPEEHQHL